MNIDRFILNYLADYNNFKKHQVDFDRFQIISDCYYTSYLTSLLFFEQQIVVKIPADYIPYRTDKLLNSLRTNKYVDRFAFAIFLQRQKFYRLFDNIKFKMSFFLPNDNLTNIPNIVVFNLPEQYVFKMVEKFSKRCTWKYEKIIGEKVFKFTNGNYEALKYVLINLSKLNTKKDINNFFLNIICSQKVNKMVKKEAKEIIQNLFDPNVDFKLFLEKILSLNKDDIFFKILKKQINEMLKERLLENVKEIKSNDAQTILSKMACLENAKNKYEVINVITELFILIRR